MEATNKDLGILVIVEKLGEKQEQLNEKCGALESERTMSRYLVQEREKLQEDLKCALTQRDEKTVNLKDALKLLDIKKEEITALEEKLQVASENLRISEQLTVTIGKQKQEVIKAFYENKELLKDLIADVVNDAKKGNKINDRLITKALNNMQIKP